MNPYGHLNENYLLKDTYSDVEIRQIQTAWRERAYGPFDLDLIPDFHSNAKGITNNGDNSCFVNSTLQAIFSLRHIMEHLYKYPYFNNHSYILKHGSNFPVLNIFIRIIKSRFGDNRDYFLNHVDQLKGIFKYNNLQMAANNDIVPLSFRTLVGLFNNNQQDACEFFSEFWNLLNHQFYVMSAFKYEQPIETFDSNANGGHHRFLSKYTTLTYRYNLICNNQHERDINNSIHNFVPLGIEKPAIRSVGEAINHYFMTERINDSPCNTCSSRNILAYHKITGLPDILIIQLKRFQVSKIF